MDSLAVSSGSYSISTEASGEGKYYSYGTPRYVVAAGIWGDYYGDV